jgi:hypothetical protein
MRFLTISVIAVVFAFRSTSDAAPTPGTAALDAQDHAAAKGPQVEELLVPIYGKPRAKIEAGSGACWGTLSDGEVFREIRALSREGFVQNAGQPAPPLRILREFFAPASDVERTRDGLLGHYVFIVECTKSDLKHVMVAPTK